MPIGIFMLCHMAIAVKADGKFWKFTQAVSIFLIRTIWRLSLTRQKLTSMV
jgi:hypothetical protein